MKNNMLAVPTHRNSISNISQKMKYYCSHSRKSRHTYSEDNNIFPHLSVSTQPVPLARPTEQVKMQPEAFIQKDINPGEVTPTKKLDTDEPDEHYSLGLRQLETTGKKATHPEPIAPTNHRQNTEYVRRRKNLSMYDYKKFKHI